MISTPVKSTLRIGKTTVFVVLILLALVASALYLNPFGLNDTASSFITNQINHAQSKPQVHATNSDHPLAFNWQLNSHTAYQYNYNVVGTDDQGKPVGGPPDLIVEGSLNVRVLDVIDEGIILGMEIKKAKLSINGGTRDWSTGPFALLMDKQGKLKQPILPKSWDSETKHFVTEQFAFSAVINASSNKQSIADKQWTAEESDNIGSFTAHYSQLSDTQMTKSKTSYHTISSTFTPNFNIVQSTADITLGQVWLSEFHSIESLVYSMENNLKFGFLEHNQLRENNTLVNHDLSLFSIPLGLGVEGISNYIGDMAVNQSEVAIERISESIEIESLESLYGDMPFNTLLDKVASTINAAKTHSDTLVEIEAMIGWLKANPNSANEIYELIRSDTPPSDDITARLIHALSMSPHTATAQETLGNIVADKQLDWIHRMQAIVATGEAQHIENETLANSLWNEAFPEKVSSVVEQQQISFSSMYALGRVAKNDSALATALESRIITLLNNPSADNDSVAVAFGTLINMGNYSEPLVHRALDIVKTQSLPTEMRVNALEYLTTDMNSYSQISTTTDTDNRVVGNERQLAIMNTVVNAIDDSDSNMRMLAARTLQTNHNRATKDESGNQSIEIVNQIIAQLEKEQIESVYAQLLLALGSYQQSVNKARNFLEQQAAIADPKYNAFVAQALAQ